MLSLFTFFTESLLDPKIASVVPTSRHSAAKICDHVDTSVRRVIVEYGPGMGAISKELLKRMNPDSQLVLIELNENFCNDLRKNIRDVRVKIFYDTAEHAKEILEQCGETKADYVISGIPFSQMDPATRRQIVTMTRDILSESGHFVVYQVLDTVKEDLEHVFNCVEKERARLNLPPLVIFDAHA